MVLQQFAVEGFAAFHQEWEHYHILQGQRVTVALPDGRYLTGLARGVSNTGALILATDHGLEEINTGELSVSAT